MPIWPWRMEPEACKLSSVASYKCTRKPPPPSHLPKIPPFMSFGRLFTANKQKYMVGWVKVKCECHGEHRKRLARVSHEHTSLPLPPCLFNINLITTKDFKSDKLKKKNHTHSARQGREVCFQWLFGERTQGHLYRPIFVRSVFLDSTNTNRSHTGRRFLTHESGPSICWT